MKMLMALFCFMLAVFFETGGAAECDPLNCSATDPSIVSQSGSNEPELETRLPNCNVQEPSAIFNSSRGQGQGIKPSQVESE